MPRGLQQKSGISFRGSAPLVAVGKSEIGDSTCVNLNSIYTMYIGE